MNSLLLPVAVLALVLFVVGNRCGRTVRKTSADVTVLIAAAICALPGILFALYYLHLFDDAVWFYEFRSWPLTELSAAGAGLLAGLLHAWIARAGFRLRTLMPLLLGAGLLVPYLKPLVSPLHIGTLAGVCEHGVCLQTTPSTCGPASVATILRMYDFQETEKTIAREAFTTAGGTENWYLARAVRRRGFTVRYQVLDRPVRELPYPAVAGVRLPDGMGHFIAVIGETDTDYVVGDPMSGRVHVEKSNPAGSYHFTGFFMRIGKPDF